MSPARGDRTFTVKRSFLSPLRGSERIEHSLPGAHAPGYFLGVPCGAKSERNHSVAAPTVRQIFICPAADAPMQEVREVMALAGRGLEGDRYALGTGTYSASPRDISRHATLIAYDDIETARRLGSEFHPAETRRNIVIDGIAVADMNALVGQTFRLGAALVKAVEICIPCARPSLLSGKPGFQEKFDQGGGLRVEILEDGRIATGDALVR